MHRYTILFLITFGFILGCSKETPSDSSKKLYTRSLDQIKKSLMGSWDLKSRCTITIAGMNCQEIQNESIIFSASDSLFWTRDNEIVKKDKIEFKRVKAQGDEYKTDSLYVFRFAKDTGFYFPYDLRNDTLIIRGLVNEIDAAGQMVFTKSKYSY